MKLITIILTTMAIFTFGSAFAKECDYSYSEPEFNYSLCINTSDFASKTFISDPSEVMGSLKDLKITFDKNLNWSVKGKQRDYNSNQWKPFSVSGVGVVSIAPLFGGSPSFENPLMISLGDRAGRYFGFQPFGAIPSAEEESGYFLFFEKLLLKELK